MPLPPPPVVTSSPLTIPQQQTLAASSSTSETAYPASNSQTLMLRDFLMQQQAAAYQQQWFMHLVAAAQQQQLVQNCMAAAAATSNMSSASQQLDLVLHNLYPNMATQPPLQMLGTSIENSAAKKHVDPKKEQIRLAGNRAKEKILIQRHEEQKQHKQQHQSYLSMQHPLPAAVANSAVGKLSHLQSIIPSSRNHPINSNADGLQHASSNSYGSNKRLPPPPAHQQLTTRERSQLSLLTQSVSADIPTLHRAITTHHCSSVSPSTFDCPASSQSKRIKLDPVQNQQQLASQSSPITSSYLTEKSSDLLAVSNSSLLATFPLSSTSCNSTSCNSTCSPTGSLASSYSDGTLTPAAIGFAASPAPSSADSVCCEQLLSVVRPPSGSGGMVPLANAVSESRLPSKKAWLAKHLAESSSAAGAQQQLVNEESLRNAVEPSFNQLVMSTCTSRAASDSCSMNDTSMVAVGRGIKRQHDSDSQLNELLQMQSSPAASAAVAAAAVSAALRLSLVAAAGMKKNVMAPLPPPPPPPSSSSSSHMSNADANVQDLVANFLCENSFTKKMKQRRVWAKDKHAVERNPAPNYSTLAAKALNLQSRDYFERTGESFVQDAICLKIAPKLVKCRECRQASLRKSKKDALNPAIYCRFVAFRRLKFNKKGVLTVSGFCDVSIADREDIAVWMPHYPILQANMDTHIARYIVQHVGDKFNDLIEQEKSFKRKSLKFGMNDPPLDDASSSCKGSSHLSHLTPTASAPTGTSLNRRTSRLISHIAWKRAVQGVREMCDVCETTLFNFHWTCPKCGYAVCMDCYESRTLREVERPKSALADLSDCNGTALPPTMSLSASQPPSAAKLKSFSNEHPWQTCSANRQAHNADKLMLTQIIPGDALLEVGRYLQEAKEKWCLNSTFAPILSHAVGVAAFRGKDVDARPQIDVTQEACLKSSGETETDVAACLPTVVQQSSCRPVLIGCSIQSDSSYSQALLNAENVDMLPLPQDPLSILAEVACSSAVSSFACANIEQPRTPDCGDPPTLTPHHFNHYFPRSGQAMIGRHEALQKRSLCESTPRYPDVPHSWLCNGKLLRLHESKNTTQLALFQEQWIRGQPVIVSACHNYLQADLWTPKSFVNEFGAKKVNVINCKTGLQLPPMSMSQFWKGFDELKHRVLLNEHGRPLSLKLKDWPPTEDFMNLLPKHFCDVMKALPLQEYTSRNGILNLASRLPEYFVPPDLGPKLYSAYGMADAEKEGTTNLHLDVADAVNLMLHVAVPDDEKNGQCDAVLRAIENARCDVATLQRAQEAHVEFLKGNNVELPGALWHIFDACDADKIRDFLNKISKECGEKLEPDHDAIHDQSCYLSRSSLDRLAAEYDVHGYTIIQFTGDAVFIPAGAPHQVRNLHSCIKAAQDFVSPENIYHCFKLTAEFRLLSTTHQNHEDKLQVKNVIYHAVKDAVAVLCANSSSKTRESVDENAIACSSQLK